MELVFVTPLMTHSVIGWSNTVALSNIPAMLMTLCVSQLPTGWENDTAPRNMLDMVVTWCVSQPLMSSSKVAWFMKRFDMSVT